MIVIVRNKLIMQQGDDTSFRIILNDYNGKQVIISEGDVLTLRMRRKDSGDIVLSKEAIPTNVITENGVELYHIINFTYKDTIDLPFGEYLYDVILEAENKRFTVVTLSTFVLEETASFKDIENNSDGTVIMFDNDEGTDFTYTLSPTPLVGKFGHVNYTRTSNNLNDDLIMF